MEGYHPAVEEYLETILELEESGIRPMRARIVERLHVSAPAVSETVRRLEREGYLTLDESRAIQLTRKGRTYATSIMRRHRLAERLLTDVLKVPWSQVHEEAGRLEHAISPRLEQHLVALLGDPGTCPHGNPIPGSVNAVDVATQISLGSAPVGSTVVVRRIDEELEAQYDRMQELEAGRVMPGHMLQVLEPERPDLQRFDSDGAVIELRSAVTAKVYVTVE
jgi:DtxR family transcriptional regulator, Mn-dependent transcriptional regulator